MPKCTKSVRNRARKNWHLTPDPQSKQLYTNAQSKLRNSIKKFKQDSWNYKLQKPTTEDNSVWRTTSSLNKKRIAIHHLTNPDYANNKAVTNHQNAEALATAYQDQFKDNDIQDSITNDLVYSKINSFNNTCHPVISHSINPSEIIQLIKDTKINKAQVKHNVII
ncbi:hypothetical protein CEXT_423161 [Caerostris extrusa]|uniref:Uncharacterized protein n=1 Tax=Caerostris extrusa TaxID=172846 RepID=A0AAV4VR18_CAEEX|nr:hypothetical protein CEXT_423161 [Caerostris extrusa]